jgi:hypothetical protein
LNEVKALREAAARCRAEARSLSAKFDKRHKAALLARARRFEQQAAKLNL